MPAAGSHSQTAGIFVIRPVIFFDQRGQDFTRPSLNASASLSVITQLVGLFLQFGLEQQSSARPNLKAAD